MLTSKLYKKFKGQQLNIAEKIQQRRYQILIHSCEYYVFDRNIITDSDWDRLAMELVRLQTDYPDISKIVPYAEAFKNFDGSSGYDLPVHDKDIVAKAEYLWKIKDKPIAQPTIKQEPKKQAQKRLF